MSRKEYFREYYRRNRTKLNNQARIRRRKNNEEVRRKEREYYKKNRDKILKQKIDKDVIRRTKWYSLTDEEKEDVLFNYCKEWLKGDIDEKS